MRKRRTRIEILEDSKMYCMEEIEKKKQEIESLQRVIEFDEIVSIVFRKIKILPFGSR